MAAGWVVMAVRKDYGLTPHPQDIVRVHPGVMVDGRNLGGMHLTVTSAVTVVELDATETAGGRPIHLLASQVDVIHSFGGIR